MSRIRIGSLADLPDEAGVLVEVGGHRVAIFRVDGKVYALGDRCSHAEASLAEGEVFDDEVECPRHGSAFGLADGVPRSLPATSPVPIYQADVEDDVVYLTIDEES
jgi:3-phenylpropionate/trans-cinnamate dioxygenase ferredoxin subunit